MHGPHDTTNPVEGLKEALREREEFLTRLIEGSRDCIKTLDLDGRLLTMNAGGMETLEICDFTPLRNSLWWDLWPSESREMILSAVDAARCGSVGRFVGFCPTMGGQPRWWDVSVNAILDKEGRPERLLAISRDITDRRRTEDLLGAVTEGTAAVTGAAYFESLVHHLAQALGVRYVFVAECHQQGRARSRAFWKAGELGENFEYDLEGTPCFDVAGKVCCYTRDVRKSFPENQALATLGAESYVGVPVADSSRNIVGHLVVLDVKPIDTYPLWVSVLQTFAMRAAAEMERERASEKLRDALAEVETLKNRLQAENVYLQEEIRKEHNFEEMVGNSTAARYPSQHAQKPHEKAGGPAHHDIS